MDRFTDFIKGDPTKEPMPLYIKPDRKLSVRDVQNGMRDHFERTDLDMIRDIGAGTLQGTLSLASDVLYGRLRGISE